LGLVEKSSIRNCKFIERIGCIGEGAVGFLKKSESANDVTVGAGMEMWEVVGHS